MNGTIYGLIDSDTLELRYVGQTIQTLNRRFVHHTSGGNNPHLNHWLNGAQVSIITLEHNPDDLNEAEMDWIRRMREQDARLINIAEGGSHGRHSEESLAKMSAAQTGRKHSSEHRAKISAAQIGRKVSLETRTEISAAMQGKQNTLGYRHTPKAITKISAAMRRPRIKRCAA